MAIRSFMSARCPHCNQLFIFSSWPDGSIRKRDHWNCPKAPPGPPDPPREYRQGTVWPKKVDEGEH